MKIRNKLSRNPLIYQSQKNKALDEAKTLFFKYLEEFALNKNLSENETQLIKKYFLEVYLEKKASYIFEDKLNDLSSYLNHALAYALSGSHQKQAETDNFTKVFYYRNKKGKLSYA